MARVGQRFGRLVVDSVENRVGHGRWAYCICECGNEKFIRINALKSGSTKSCGCLNRERHTRHGYLAKEYPHRATYYCWRSMVARCHNLNDSSFARYGGRGITVCDRWRESFESYLEDIGPKPSHRHSLDRIDNDLGYFPGNVRWATSEEQARNRRSNRILAWDGRETSLTGWAEEYGIKPATLWARLRSGWSMGEALEQHGPRGPGKWRQKHMPIVSGLEPPRERMEELENLAR